MIGSSCFVQRNFLYWDAAFIIYHSQCCTFRSRRGQENLNSGDVNNISLPHALRWSGYICEYLKFSWLEKWLLCAKFEPHLTNFVSPGESQEPILCLSSEWFVNHRVFGCRQKFKICILYFNVCNINLSVLRSVAAWSRIDDVHASLHLWELFTKSLYRFSLHKDPCHSSQYPILKLYRLLMLRGCTTSWFPAFLACSVESEFSQIIQFIWENSVSIDLISLIESPFERHFPAVHGWNLRNLLLPRAGCKYPQP